MTSDEQLDADALQRLVDRVKPDTALLPGQQDELAARMLRMLENQPSAALCARPQHAKHFLLRLIPTAAALVVVCVLIWMLLLSPMTPVASAGFAEVVRNIATATTVEYDLVLRVPGEPDYKNHVIISFPDRSKVVSPDGKTVISDARKNLCLTFTPARKKATLRPLSNSRPYENYVRDLRELSASAGRQAGILKDGRPLVRYDVSKDGRNMTILVDPARDLPVRIDITDTSNQLIVMENILWNQHFDASVFAVEVPDGYSLQEDESQLDEQVIIRLLRTYVQKSEGVFPESLDKKTLQRLILRGSSTRSVDANGSFVILRARDEVVAEGRERLADLAAVERMRKEGHFRYLGRGLKKGDTSAPLAAWTFNGHNWRMAFADLRVQDVASDAVPEEPGKTEASSQ